MAKLYCIANCEVDLQPYHAGQVLDVSEAQVALLLRAAPSSFSAEDPAAEAERQAAVLAEQQLLEAEQLRVEQEQAEAERKQRELEAAEQEKALGTPPADKMVKAPERKK